MRVAILGTVPASKHLAPFTDNEWEIWVCSPGNRGGCIPRVSKWFELHGVVDLKGAENTSWNTEYFAWLRSQTFPVYMQEPNDLVPQAITFPLKAWLAEFGRMGRIGATSSIAFMIGFAVMSGATEIGIFGVDMAATEEHYGGQKCGCHIMIELAKQRGVKVVIPHESSLSSMPPLYGYAEASAKGRHLLVRELELKQQISNLDATISRLNNERNYFAGGLESTQYIRRTFVDGEHDAELDVEVETLNPGEGTMPAAFMHRSEPVAIPSLSEVGTGYEQTHAGVLVPSRRANGNGAAKPGGAA